jgi:8-oxo-dGTP pyrophosphatase MutT (NUDIX family)
MPHINELYDYTVSFFVLHPTEPKICLHFHKKLGFWNNLGGHIELDEDPLETLEKELYEESGLKPENYTIIETHQGPSGIGVKELPNPFGLHMYKYGDKNHWHIDMPYIIKSKTAVLQPLEGESQQIDWFDIPAIQDMSKNKQVDPSTLKICEWIADKYFD